MCEFIICAFSFEYEEDEEGYFGKKGIKFDIEPPAVDARVYAEVEELEFIEFLRKMTEQYIEKYPIDKTVDEDLFRCFRENLLKRIND